MAARDAPVWWRSKAAALERAGMERRRGWFESKAAAERAAREDVKAGLRRDARGREAVREITGVRKAGAGKGGAIEVKVAWEGCDPVTRRPWPDSWVAQRNLTADLRREARGAWNAARKKARAVREAQPRETARRKSPRLAGC